MNGAKAAGESKNQNAKPLLGALRIALVAAAAVTLWDAAQKAIRIELASAQEADRVEHQEYGEERASYLWGGALAISLTLVPFGLVYWSWLQGFWLYVALGGFALTQVIVHFRFFLHIKPWGQKKEDLQLILFSSLIVVMMAGGTIWVLNNLATRMH